MIPLETLGFMLGASFASGINLYATVAVLGLLNRFGGYPLPPQLEPLAHPLVLGIAVFLYVVEFVADKIPYVDNIWDLLHTFIRPPAAALLAYGAVADVPGEWRIAASLLAGGVALASHGTKASTRAAVNTSPEPVSNSLISLGEDGIAVFLAWMATAHPVMTIVVVVLLLAIAAYCIVKFFGFLRRMMRRFLRREPQPLHP